MSTQEDEIDQLNNEILISVRDLKFSRGDRVIFDGIDLDIQKGKVTAIMGPSGTGKTTLLRLIGGQLRPDFGSVSIDGDVVHQISHLKLYALRKKLGMLFQNGALLTDISVYENVAFPIREHTKLPERMIHDLVLMKLNAVGLRGAKNLMPSELSGGMARRVALARAIALDPDIIMYDEPFTGQDPISMGVVVRLIRDLNNALGLTSVIVSHDIEETKRIADYIYLLSEGKVVAHGSPDSLDNSDSDWAQQFLKGKPDGPVPFHYPATDYQQELLQGYRK
jgi:phospholipid/cholesterol/gamma-HCH transport system ATP-binding protein